MSEHNLNIHADIDVAKVQSKLDRLNQRNKQQSTSSATDPDVLMKSLQHSIDALNKTLQSIVNGTASHAGNSTGNSSVLTDAALMKRWSSSTTNNHTLGSQLEGALLPQRPPSPYANTSNYWLDEARRIAANRLNMMGAADLLGRPLTKSYVRHYNLPPYSLMSPVYEQAADWNTIASRSNRNLVNSIPALIQGSRNIARQNPWIGAGIGFAGHAMGSLGHGLAEAGYNDAGQWLTSGGHIAMSTAAGFTLGGPIGAVIGGAVGAISELAAAAGRASKELSQLRASGAEAAFDTGAQWKKWSLQFVTDEQLMSKRDELKSSEKFLRQRQGQIAKELESTTPESVGLFEGFAAYIAENLGGKDFNWVREIERKAGSKQHYQQLTNMAEQIQKQDLPNVSGMLQAYEAELQARPTRYTENEYEDYLNNKSHEEFINEILQNYEDSANLIKQREEALLELENAMKVQGVDILDSMSKQGKWMSSFAMSSTSNELFNPVTAKMDNIISKLEHLASIDNEIKRLDMGLK